MLILDFLPNWRNGVTETREYLTNIMTAYDQTEQRAALRDKPRNTMAYTLTMHGADASRFDWVLTAAQAQVLLMPYWPMPFHLTAAAGNGATTLLLDGNLPPWVVAGEQLALLYGGKSSVAVTVQAVAGKTVTIAAPGLPGAWPKGALVYPTWQVRAQDSVAAKRYTPTVTETAITLTRQITGAAVPVPAAAADMVYDSLEVLTRDINWRDGQDVSMAWITELLDGQRGRTAYEVLSRVQQRTSSGSVLINGVDQANWWQAFYDRHKGRRGVFYAPTRSRDLPLVKSPTPAKSVFAVSGTQFHALMQPDTSMLTHIMVKLQTGRYQLFKITSLEVDYVNDVTYVKTLEPWTQAYRPEQALAYYLASKCRLGSDTMTINWRAALLGETGIAVTTVGANW
ncbi:hypothetical protein phiA034_gene0013 [Aeromonas phage phiA034]|uniref:Virion structural protein n=1 Tax=Aeromonas phage phiA034 TaxID=2985287 RepID=A0AAE9YG52_9CAUD|nr:hypothetical protein phiA034_gene0013 [Aeromonas phage phiA034]